MTWMQMMKTNGERDVMHWILIASVTTIMLMLCIGCGGVGDAGKASMRLAGTVQNAETNEPIEGAQVIINGYRTQTNSQGQFALDITPPSADESIPLTIAKDGFTTYSERVRLPPDTPSYTFSEPFLLQPMADSGTVQGKLVKQQTAVTVGNALVSVITDGGATITGWSANDGLFILSGVPTGEGWLRVEHPDYLSHSQRIAIVQGSNDVGTINLLPLGTPIEVKGIVLDAEEQSPVKGATVTIAGMQAITDANGEFTIQQVPSGTQTVQVKHDDYEPLEMTTQIRGESLTLFITPKGNLPGLPYTIGGVVRKADGKPAQGALVQLLNAQTQQQMRVTQTDANGFYSFFVPAGEYIIRVQFQGYQTAEKRITLPYGGVILTDVNFELQPE